MPQPDLQQSTPRQALALSRIMWAALLLGPVAFFIVIGALQASGSNPVDRDAATLLFYLSIGMLVAAIPFAYILRSQIYKRHWEGDHVTPAGYLTGNLLFWAVFEGVAFLSLVATLFHDALMPTVVPALVAIGLNAINFPTGSSMTTTMPHPSHPTDEP